jgi:hypothetical protein
MSRPAKQMFLLTGRRSVVLTMGACRHTTED